LKAAWQVNNCPALIIIEKNMAGLFLAKAVKPLLSRALAR